MSEEFKAIETQAAFDEAIKERLQRQERSIMEKYKGYLSPDAVTAQTAELNEQIEALKSAADQSEAQLAEMTKKAQQYETEAVKIRIAQETGLPIDLASRLNGTTVDELKADAQALAQYTVSRGGTPVYQPEAPESDTTSAAMREVLRSLTTQ